MKNKGNTANESSNKVDLFNLVKGELVGGFKFGSTVVMVFESDKTAQWAVEEGQSICVGDVLMRDGS